MFQKIRIFLLIIVLLGSLLVFLINTQPDNLPLPLLIVPFLLIFAIVYMLTYVVVRLLIERRRRLIKKDMIWCFVVAFVPTLLAVFQSLHQLTIKDALITICFVGVMGLYLSRFQGVSGRTGK